MNGVALDVYTRFGKILKDFQKIAVDSIFLYFVE